MRLAIVRLLVPLIVVAAWASTAQAQTCDATPLVIANVNVWTPEGFQPRRDVTIVDGRVASVVATSGKTAQGRRIDGTGHTLLPGLIDTHLHFSIPGGLPATNGPRTDGDQITARQVLRSGVTSGRLHLASLENAIALKQHSLDPCAAIPRLQVGGPGISGAQQKDNPVFMGGYSVEDAVGKVRKFAAAGVDWLAVHDAHRFPPGVLQAIAGAARKANVRLMAAGNTADEIRAALSIDPDTLDYFDRTAATGYDEAILAGIRARRRMILAPTPGVPFRMIQYRQHPARLEEAANFRGFSDADREFVLANAKKVLDSAEMTRNLDVVPTIANKLKQLRSTGLSMAIASDAGSTMQFQPNAVWWEMESWRANGIPARDVLIAATVGGARVLRLDDVGHLRPGARGDFVLYRGNVEEGPFDVTRVLSVGKGGIVFN
ncbi:MAG TPA: amidohydrolase family protein [Vicinamibacterales bacterium]|nr:amidohydrolase family protein [Vicinamibacterales bacterium]